MNVIMKNICKEVPNDLALFSSFVLKKKLHSILQWAYLKNIIPIYLKRF